MEISNNLLYLFTSQLVVMVAIIKKGDDKKSISTELAKIKSKKGLDPKKFCGILLLKENPNEIQKKMRDEWK